jgi:hypothetical protein
VSLVPVYLRQAGSAISESHTSDTLSFSPTPAPVDFAQSCDFTN